MLDIDTPHAVNVRAVAPNAVPIRTGGSAVLLVPTPGTPGTDGVDGTVADVTRIGVFQFANPSAIFTAFKVNVIRKVFILPLSAKRFRVHVKNYSQATDANGTHDLTSFQIHMGSPVVSADGTLPGNFTAAPTVIQSPTTVTVGTEYISPWIDPGIFALDEADRLYMLSIGCDQSAASIALGSGPCWRSSSGNPNDSALASPPGIAMDAGNSFLLTFIEYEFADNAAPVTIVLGHSMSQTAATSLGDVHAWHHLWERRVDGVVGSLGSAGLWAAHFAVDGPKWSLYDQLSQPLNPDYVVLAMLSGSDIGGNATEEVAESTVLDVINLARGKYPTARIILTTNPPRADIGNPTNEATRIAHNAWLQTCPNGADACVDVDALLTDWADTPAQHAVLNSGDGVHPGPRGHTAIATAMPMARQSAPGTGPPGAPGAPGAPGTGGGGGTDWAPADFDLLAWSFSPLGISDRVATTFGGALFLTGIQIPEAMTVTNVHIFMLEPGVNLTAGQSFATLYQNGNLLAVTADQAVPWSTTSGRQDMALLPGPQDVDAGLVYVGFWSGGGDTLPSPGALAAVQQAFSVSIDRYAFDFASYPLSTTAPATLGTLMAGIGYWAAVS